MQNTQTTQTTKPKDVYEIVTNRIIEYLEKGVVPWQQPWTEAGHPKNLISGRNYRGINVWLLNTLNYSQNYFLTFKQVQDLGAKIKKGEKAHEVVFWKQTVKNNNEEDKEKKEIKINEKPEKDIKVVRILRYYKVFNIDQCEGIPIEKIPKQEERQNDPIETCEKIINEMPKRPKIISKDQKAYYHKGEDYINMPKMETFLSSESYYGALFHELIHSVGHKERLNRKELTQSKGKRTNDYAVEELTAEMGASYLKSYAGIPIEQLENNAAYIQHWLERLKKDKKFIVFASSQAQKAADYILNVRDEERKLSQDGETVDKFDETNERGNGLKEIREKIFEKSLEYNR